MNDIKHLDFETDIPDVDDVIDDWDDGSDDYDNFIRCPCGFVAGSDDVVHGSKMVGTAYELHVCDYRSISNARRITKGDLFTRVLMPIIFGFALTLLLKSYGIIP